MGKIFEVKAPKTVQEDSKYYSGIDSFAKSIFLAGTIDMGNSIDWQTAVVNRFQTAAEYIIWPIVIYNPRRDDWDSTWVQDPMPGTKFNEQVNWELKNIDDSDIIFFNFLPDSKSPITLLELGLALNNRTEKKLIICCPKEFYRYGNVRLTVNRYSDNAKFFTNFEDAVDDLIMTVAK